MSKKIYYCVVGSFNGRTVSVPGHLSYAEAFAYGDRKGWIDIDIVCEGSKEG